MPERDWARAGLHILRGFASDHQTELAEVVARIAKSSPWFTPVMQDGTPFRCQVTGAGAAVFHSSPERGYHYAREHPVDGNAWTEIPDMARKIATDALEAAREHSQGFDAMLLNRYDSAGGERLGLHNDVDEQVLDAPIVTISIGADCEFLVGGLERSDPVESTILSSGDVLVMARQGRLWHHGVKRVLPSMFSPLGHGVRVCLSLRLVYR